MRLHEPGCIRLYRSHAHSLHQALTAGAGARDTDPLRAAERERERLAREEAEAAARLGELQAELDRVTEALVTAAKRQPGSGLTRHIEQTSAVLRASIDRGHSGLKRGEVSMR